MPEHPQPPPQASPNVSLIQEKSSPPPVENLAAEELQQFKRAREELLLEDLGNEIQARRTYADRIFWFMIGWIAIMTLFVLADAIRWPWASRHVGFELSDTVLVTLVTTTTATVVGVFLIVAKYLYRTR